MPRAPARWLALGLAGAGLFVAALDAYVVVTLLPRMLSDLNLSIDHIEVATPIISGFLGGYVVAMPLLGAFSDARGRIPAYLLALCVFGVGSVVTAWASDLNPLVAGRVLQGLGGGALVPLALALAADLYPPGPGSGRSLALGAISALQESGSVFGPLYGAGLAAAGAGLGGWRFVFLFNLPLAALVGAGLALGVGLKAPRSGHRGHASGVDWAGALLLGAGLALLVLALYPDDPAHRAANARVVPLALLAALALSGYGWRQASVLRPLIPPTLLRSRQFLGSTAANLLAGAALIVALVDVPILGRGVFGVDQLHAGLLLTQFLVGVPVGALAGGFLAGRLGQRWTAVLGFALAALAFYLMSGWHGDELNHHLGLLRTADLTLGLCGLGFGLMIAPLAGAVLDLTGQREHGLASSLVVLARTLGMVVGLSALTAFGLHRFYQILALNPPHSISDLEAKVVGALLGEYHDIFRVAAGICLLALVVALVSLPGRARALGRREAGPAGPD